MNLRPARTSDGNLIFSGGEYIQLSQFAFDYNAILAKTTTKGEAIWVKRITGGMPEERGYSLYISEELSNGNIISVGSIGIQMPSNGTQELVLMCLTANGQIIWNKTFKSPLWADSTSGKFIITQIKEDNTGDFYLVGYIAQDQPTHAIILKFSASGNLLWSQSIQESTFSTTGDACFINGNEVVLFGISKDILLNSPNIFAARLNSITGDTIQVRKWIVDTKRPLQTNFTNINITELNNGNISIYGPTGLSSAPDSGNIYRHFGILEMDKNLNLINGSQTISHTKAYPQIFRVKVFADGTANFLVSRDPIPLNDTVSYFGYLKNNNLIKQSIINHNSSFLPNYTLDFIKMPDDGTLFIARNRFSQSNNSIFEFHHVHITDTSSICFSKDTIVFWTDTLKFKEYKRGNDSLKRNIVVETLRPQPSVSDITAFTLEQCKLVSYCDTLRITPIKDTACSFQPFLIRTKKGPACGAPIIWEYPDSVINGYTILNDSTYAFYFSKSWQGYIYGSLETKCTNFKDSTFVTVLISPDSLNLGLDTFLCPGNTIILNAHSGYKNYEWQDGSTDSVFTVLQPGIYHVKATNACGDVFFDTINVFPRSGTLFSLGPDRSKCNKDSIQLNAPSGFLSYSWSPDYNITGSGTQSPYVFPDTTTEYILTAEKPTGCFSKDTIKVLVNKSPVINLGTDTSICETDSLVLNAGSGFINYQWSTGSISPHIIINAVGSYWVNATDANTCRSTDTIKLLSKYSDPVVNLNKDTILCSNTTKTLDAGGGFLNYLWQNGSSNQILLVTDTGRYWVQVTDSHFCKGSDTTYIKKIATTPSGFLPLDSTKCTYGSILISALQNFEEYIWNNGQINASIFITDPGLYILKVKDDLGCEGSDSIRIYTKDCIKGVFFPNAFTPNGKAPNDFFKPLVFGKLNFIHLSIYNRWGEMVFDSHNPSAKWDGNFKGIKQPGGTYIWVCNYQLEGETARSQKGYLVLIR